MVETMKATILSPSNTGLKVTIEDACAASAQGVDSSDIRDASNMKHKGTARKSQKEPPPHPGCHLSGDILPHPGQSSATMIIADYFGVTLTSYMPDHTLKSQIEATMGICLQFNALTGRTSGVRRIAFDGETACRGSAFRQSLAMIGVYVAPGDPTYHCPRAERAIQEIKRMAARIQAMLLWRPTGIPRAYHHLLTHCCYIRAHLVRPGHDPSGITPYHELTGSTRSWRGCALLPYGSVVSALRTAEGEWHSEHLSLKNFFERPFRPFPICKTIARSQPDPQNRARCPVHREEVDFLQLI
jgi:hypothetical protein